MQHVPMWKCRVFFAGIAIETMQGVPMWKHLMFFASVAKQHTLFVSHNSTVGKNRVSIVLKYVVVLRVTINSQETHLYLH